MDTITGFVAWIIANVQAFIAPHEFALVMLIFAIVWGYNMVAPAFRKGARK